MKIIAFYLPQFHEIPENNSWWGKGYTEWTNLKRSVPLFKEHNQPRIPLNGNYYNLLDANVIHWQINLAKRYGLFGFCVYHYWFCGHLLLHNPMEQYLYDKSLDFPFCFCWANENWTRSWVASSEDDILICQEYGNEKIWRKHFEYLYPFLSDDRYIKINGKPLFVIYRPELILGIERMLTLWNSWAIQCGLQGIIFAAQQRFFNIDTDKGGDLFSYQIEYQPAFVRKSLMRHLYKKEGISCIDYDVAWQEVLKYGPLNDKSVPGAFIDWDNTPRKNKRGIVIEGATPEKFQKYFSKQIQRAKTDYKKDMIFLFSWNEWSEGGYLEPDEKVQYGYLNAMRNSLIQCNCL